MRGTGGVIAAVVGALDEGVSDLILGHVKFVGDISDSELSDKAHCALLVIRLHEGGLALCAQIILFLNAPRQKLDSERVELSLQVDRGKRWWSRARRCLTYDKNGEIAARGPVSSGITLHGLTMQAILTRKEAGEEIG